MEIETLELSGQRILACAESGPLLGSEQDALDLVAASYEHAAEIIAIPVQRMAPDFWRLRTGLLGAFVQKLHNYRLRVALVGDIGDACAQSRALRDFVHESRSGGAVMFVADWAELGKRI